MFQKLSLLKKNKEYIMECNVSKTCQLTEIYSRSEVRNEAYLKMKRLICYKFFQNRSIISIFLIIVITATVKQRAYDNDQGPSGRYNS